MDYEDDDDGPLEAEDVEQPTDCPFPEPSWVETWDCHDRPTPARGRRPQHQEQTGAKT